MSEGAPPEDPAGNGEAQPALENQQTTNEPQTAADNTPQSATLNEGVVEAQPAAAFTEQSGTNGTPPVVDSGVQTEPMPTDVSNGSLPVASEEGEVQTESSTAVEPDSRPSVLIVGGLGMHLKTECLGFIY